MPNESHVEGSLEAVKGVFERLHFDTLDRETVTFLIANHLRMSATLLRRDIFDPEAVHDFAKTVGTTEHLKMLTLFTYADIKAVNPEALTSWKAEMLWQLYAATENYLNRSVDDQRSIWRERMPSSSSAWFRQAKMPWKRRDSGISWTVFRAVTC